MVATMDPAALGFTDEAFGADVDRPIDAVTAIAEVARAYGIDRFEAEHLDANLYDLACDYAREYRGTFAYVLDHQRRLRHHGGPSDGAAKGLLNCALADARRRQRPPDDRHDCRRELAGGECGICGAVLLPEPEPPAIAANVPALGTYTVVLGDDDYVTVRLREWRSKGDGTLVAEYLRGPNNDLDFQGFAAINPDGTRRLWRSYSSPRLDAALSVLLGADDEAQAGMGHGYALLSGRCYRCGRTLTVPASIHRGLGPDCAAKMAEGAA